MQPAVIYAEELGRIGYGKPLWMPEQPSEASIELGDVGFIERSTYFPRCDVSELMMLPGSGAFTRLFNATRPSGDPLNVKGVPEDFVQLDISNMSKAEHPRFLSNGPIVSKSVKMTAIQPAISGGRCSIPMSEGRSLC